MRNLKKDLKEVREQATWISGNGKSTRSKEQVWGPEAGTLVRMNTTGKRTAEWGKKAVAQKINEVITRGGTDMATRGQR